MKTILEVTDEIRSLGRRTIRSLADEHITPADAVFIIGRLDKIKERIVEIKERPITNQGGSKHGNTK